MFNFFFSDAYAQAAAGAQAQANPIMSFLPFIVIFAIFYFLMIRPQKQTMQKEEQMRSALSKGDEIYTKSGIIGSVHGLTDKVITLEVEEGTKLKVLRSQVAGLLKDVLGPKQAENK